MKSVAEYETVGSFQMTHNENEAEAASKNDNHPRNIKLSDGEGETT